MMDYPGPGLIETVINQNDFMPISVDEDVSAALPLSFEIHQNYPNPFSPQTTIQYALAEDSRISLQIYGSLGQEVRVLADEHKDAGLHTIVWDGRNDAGRRVPSGTYFLRLEAGDYTATKKLSVIR
jgi:hypothetical protein